MTAPSFTYSGNIYTGGTAGTVDFALTSTSGNPISYLQAAHIHVYKSSNSGSTWTELSRPSQWGFVSGGTVARLVTGIASGEWVKVQRITPSTSAYVTFQSSSLLTADQLNDDTLFNTYLNQERYDQGDQSAAVAAAASAASASATTTANTALSTANTAAANAATAISTANTASSNAGAAAATANTALTNASAAVTTANAASTNASAAVTTANTASTNASAAVSTANTASANASAAANTANTAAANAATAITTANSAASNATAAVATANTASTNASAAVTTANTAATNAATAVSTANTASTNASTAVTTANTAISTANAAASAVASAILYDIVANVAAIPGSPANNDAVEITNSTGIESFSPLSGLPSGFVGNSALSVRLVYTTSGSTWNWIQYFPNDPETRYLKTGTGTVTSTNIADGTIVNADINASAAIAGTKISPDFGSQTVQTTGIFSHALGTAGAPTITFTGDTNTGIYSPGADQVAISTNGTGRLFVDASGNVGVGSTPTASKLYLNGSLETTAAQLYLSSNQTYIDSYNYNLNLSSVLNGGIGGNIIFNTGSGTVSERMRLDSSGRLGLGTSSPNCRLEVAGGSAITTLTNSYSNCGILHQYNVNTLLAIGNDGTNPVLQGVNATNNTARNILLNPLGGSVGIGTTSVDNRLHLAYTVGSTSSEGIRLQDTTNTTVGQFQTTGSSYSYAGVTGHNALLYSSRDLAICADNANSGQIKFATGGSERGRWDSSGRFLVGTSTSASTAQGTNIQQIFSSTNDRMLGVHMGINSANGPYITFSKSRNTGYGSYSIVNNGDVLGGMIFAGDDGTDYASAGAYIEAIVDGTPGVNDLPTRLTFSVTADGASSPTERMRIAQNGKTQMFANANDNVLIMRSAEGAGTATYLFAGARSATGISDGTVVFGVFTNGNAVNTNNSYGAISDLKLKENIVDAGSQWTDLKALRVRKYNFKEGQTHTQIGLVAQEVELISPGLVSESADRDENGNDLGTVTKSVNYSVLYMKAVKALQEAMERIETLESKVAALEGA